MTTETKKGLVYIINKFKVQFQNQPFRCIMIYQDKDSGFCFIKPLLYKIPLEIVMELFRIFTSYGPPTEVDVNSCSQEMVNSIDNNMRILCPKFKIQFNKISSDKNNIALIVVSKLHKWMEITNKQQWEIGCCIVQRQINTEAEAGNSLTPHERFFKNLGGMCDDIDNSGKEFEEPKPDKQNTIVENSVPMTRVTETTNTVTKDKLNPLNNTTVTVKDEVLDTEDINVLSKNLSNYVIIYDGGMAFPNFNANRVPVKQEIAED